MLWPEATVPRPSDPYPVRMASLPPTISAFLAIVFFRNGLVQQAANELDRLDALDPPPAIGKLTAGLRAQVDAALAAPPDATTTTATVAAGG